MKKPPKKLVIGDVVLALHFVPGAPVGLSVDTRCVIREIKNARARVERDDGRDGSWWVDLDSLRRFGS